MKKTIVCMQTTAYHSPAKNWFYRYKLYHIPFWFLYHFAWWSISIGNPFIAAGNLASVYFPKFLFYVIFQAIAVYFNLYFLIPRFLEKRKFAQYVLYLGITIIVIALCITSGYYFSAYLAHTSIKAMYGFSSMAYPFLVNALPSTVASITFAMSIKLTKNWLQTQKRQQVLEKQNLETELKFLKNQFNPHYLFNTINSIFFLIHKNPDRASASLAKFSELLRYQLYECNDPQIALSKEISYLENFIELEKLRQNSNMDINADINNVYAGDMAIAPFILMTFAENAFKHVSKHTDQPNWINIQLSLQGNQLLLQVTNSVAEAEPVRLPYSGIGLENVQRRLDLIYPNKHELVINKSDDRFEVKLSLQLTELVHLRTLQKTG